GAKLEDGHVPPSFEPMTARIEKRLADLLEGFDNAIVHNVFTKRFNLPLTAALFRLQERGIPGKTIAWCHDFDWASTRSSKKLHEGFPWDLLRTYRREATYVVVSQERQETLAHLLECPVDEVRVVYNGVDPQMLVDLSPETTSLAQRLGLFDADLVLLMPVRVTRAKNIEYAIKVAAALQARGVGAKTILTGPPDPHDSASIGYFHSLQELRHRLGADEAFRFVFESGPGGKEGYTISLDVVGDLYRVSDLMFMPSHSEGFAMPVLEAGFVGIPVVATAVPAAVELAADEAMLIGEDETPEALADRLMAWAEESRVHRFRRRVRRCYTWRAIFERDIEPLLRSGDAEAET
ncbi:MAG: glycosyltransferase family 4 protein, partial [Anaerolineae bacterium]